MKYISNDEFNNIMTENEELFGEYQNVKFAAKINGKPTEITGYRVFDNKDTEYFIAKSQKGYVTFNTEEVLIFKVVSVGNHIKNEENNFNPAMKIQATIAQKIQQEKEKAAEESRLMAENLSNELGYFPLLNSANLNSLVIDFYNSKQELLDSITFPFVPGETYEVYSHEDERDIEFKSLVVDVSLAMDSDGNDVSPSLFAKYYETYNAIQDLEFIPDNQYTKEIFNQYKLDEKYAKVVGDINKHDLLEFVTEYSKDPAVKQAALELRDKSPKQQKLKI
jgi:hypothetical protein